jgi:pathogenicity locus Cdd1 protein
LWAAFLRGGFFDEGFPLAGGFDFCRTGNAARFERLGIRSVARLARASPRRLYDRLCRITGRRQDICCLDAFTAAVAQARNPRLPAEQCQWWYWSRRRKASARKR